MPRVFLAGLRPKRGLEAFLVFLEEAVPALEMRGERFCGVERVCLRIIMSLNLKSPFGPVPVSFSL
jgi:hypothetical protein